MPRLEGIDQNTDVWVVAKIGVTSSSRAKDVVAKRQDKQEAEPRKRYKHELAIERILLRKAEHYTSLSMQWGIDHQAEAAAAYEIATGSYLEPGGFWVHKSIGEFGASPDYLVGADGLVEVKCPNTATHVETLLSCEIPKDYQWQMAAQMAVTERLWVDFVSFDPRLPEGMQLFIKRFHRIAAGDKSVSAIECEVEQFNEEVDAIVQALLERGRVIPIGVGR